MEFLTWQDSLCLARMHGDRQSSVEVLRRYLETLPHDLPVREELRSARFWKSVRAEFLATLFLVLFTCAATVQWEVSDETAKETEIHLVLQELKTALVVGCTTATIVHCFGSTGSALGNPAVSVAMLVARNISPIKMIVFVLVQCVGGMAGIGILYGLTPEPYRLKNDMGLSTVNAQVHLSQAFGVEFLSTFVVVLAVLANSDPNRTETTTSALSIGLAYVIGHLFGYRFTGAGMNPIRCLGPAIVMNSWKNQWIYWIGPILGGIIGAFTYEYIRDSSSASPNLSRSFRRKYEPPSQSGLGSQETEFTANSADGRI